MPRALAVGILAVISAVWGAATNGYADPRGDTLAERAYNALPAEDRIALQAMLIATGHQNAVPNVSFNRRILAAIREFQISRGQTASGVLNAEQVKTLSDRAMNFFRMWSFEKAHHPKTGHSIWIPMGLELDEARDAHGITWRRDGVVSITFRELSHGDISRAHKDAMRALTDTGREIDYEVKRRDFFVVTASDEAANIKHYQRFQRIGSRFVGFEMFWNAAIPGLHLDRAVVLMSASLWSSATGAPFIDPPRSSAASPGNDGEIPRTATNPNHAISGTGFFVSRDGYVLTNAHVIEGCIEPRVRDSAGTKSIGTIAARDVTNDLALVKTSLVPVEVAIFRTGRLRLGEGIAAFGFPLSSVLASSGNFTLGNVTALAGPKDDSRFIQFSAPVQTGNSGGPLLDTAGNVVGVVSSKLDVLKIAASSGDIPQNVNFAITSAISKNFLEVHRVNISNGEDGSAKNAIDVGEKARAMSVYIECVATR